MLKKTVFNVKLKLLINFSFSQFHERIFRSSRTQMFFKTGVLKRFANFAGKHLCWSLFLKSLQAVGLQLHKKKTPTEVFSCAVCEIFNNTFSYRTPPMSASAPPVAASVFFLKSTIKQLFRSLAMTY